MSFLELRSKDETYGAVKYGDMYCPQPNELSPIKANYRSMLSLRNNE